VKRPFVVAAIVLFSASVASADSLNVLAGDQSWHAFESPSTRSGSSFWNHASYDGVNADCNIGYWMSGLGGCTASSGRFYEQRPQATPDFLGNAATRFGFTQDGTTASVSVTSKLNVTSWQQTDEFGWYLLSDPSQLNPLFHVVSIINETATFVPSGDYGFYLKSNDGTFHSSANPETPTHFAVFRLGSDGHYIIGAEDMWFGSDWDYNDLAFEVQMTPVPEPASLLLVCSGLVGIGTALRRRRNR
jgi:hypothetical protein